MFFNNKNNSKTVKNIFFATSATLLLLTVNNVAQADQVTANNSEIKQSVVNSANNTLIGESASSVDENENSSSSISEVNRAANFALEASEANKMSDASLLSEASSSQSTALSSTNPPSSQESANSASAATSFATAATQPDKINLGDSTYPRTDVVDIASFQYYLTQNDFNTMKAQGVKTVVVKLTEGTSYINPYAASQIQMAKNAGLTVAVYHFAWFTNESTAVAEANYFLNALKRYGLGAETAVVADMESTAVLTSSGTGNLNSFWNVLRANGYTNDIVYTSLSYDQSYNFSSTVGKKKTWIAQYPYYPRANNLLHQEYGAWQYSSTGYINGKGTIDFTIDYDGIFNADTYEEKYENGYWYVYVNGVMQTGFVRLPDGRITYYDDEGHIVNGLYKASDG
ncbi:GH25 family lysozyme, partial [Lactobacillaceae bacterium 24-114]